MITAGDSIPTLGMPHLDRLRVETLTAAARAELSLPPFLLTYIQALEVHIIEQSRQRAVEFVERSWGHFLEQDSAP